MATHTTSENSIYKRVDQRTKLSSGITWSKGNFCEIKVCSLLSQIKAQA